MLNVCSNNLSTGELGDAAVGSKIHVRCTYFFNMSRHFAMFFMSYNLCSYLRVDYYYSHLPDKQTEFQKVSIRCSVFSSCQVAGPGSTPGSSDGSTVGTTCIPQSTGEENSQMHCKACMTLAMWCSLSEPQVPHL